MTTSMALVICIGAASLAAFVFLLRLALVIRSERSGIDWGAAREDWQRVLSKKILSLPHVSFGCFGRGYVVWYENFFLHVFRWKR